MNTKQSILESAKALRLAAQQFHSAACTEDNGMKELLANDFLVEAAKLEQRAERIMAAIEATAQK